MKQINRETVDERILTFNNRRHLIFLAFRVNKQRSIGTGRAMRCNFFLVRASKSSILQRAKETWNINRLHPRSICRRRIYERSFPMNLLRFRQVISISGLLECKCGGALENVNVRNPCRLTSCLFIGSICCNPASNMLSLENRRILKFLPAKDRSLKSSLAKREPGEVETIFKWSEADDVSRILLNDLFFLPFKPI